MNLYRSQHHLLMILATSDKEPSQKELASYLDISPAAVAVTLKKLEADGFICRSCDQSDTRRKCISITEKGQSTLSQTQKIFGEIDAKMLEGLSDQQLKTLENCLAVMQENLRRMGGDEDNADA